MPPSNQGPAIAASGSGHNGYVLPAKAEGTRNGPEWCGIHGTNLLVLGPAFAGATEKDEVRTTLRGRPLLGVRQRENTPAASYEAS